VVYLFLVIHLYHERVRNKMLHLDHPQKLSIAPWLWLSVSLFGCVGYLHIWVSIWKILQLYIVTIKVLFILLTTLFFYEYTKHIKTDCHFTRHHLQLDTISLHFVPLTRQIANLFTKLHSILRFQFLFDKLSMHLALALWVWGDVRLIF